MVASFSRTAFGVRPGARTCSRFFSVTSKRMTLAADQRTIPCAADGTSDTSVVAMDTARPRVLSLKHNLGESIKCLFSKLARVLEGDHEFHKYLGM